METKIEEKKKWYDAFVEYVIEKWKENGTISSLGDEEEAKECIDAMMFLLAGYSFKCLISTLAEIDDMIEIFNEEHPEYSEEEGEEIENLSN